MAGGGGRWDYTMCGSGDFMYPEEGGGWLAAGVLHPRREERAQPWVVEHPKGCKGSVALLDQSSSEGGRRVVVCGAVRPATRRPAVARRLRLSGAALCVACWIGPLQGWLVHGVASRTVQPELC